MPHFRNGISFGVTAKVFTAYREFAELEGLGYHAYTVALAARQAELVPMLSHAALELLHKQNTQALRMRTAGHSPHFIEAMVPADVRAVYEARAQKLGPSGSVTYVARAVMLHGFVEDMNNAGFKPELS